MKKKISTALLGVLLLVSYAKSQPAWNNIPSAPTNGRFDDISVINDSTAFTGQDGYIYKTTDKGNTWNLISTLDSVGGGYIRSIEFVNDTIGFAGMLYSAAPLLGNTYKTTDGGYTWTLLQNMQIQSSDGICGMAHYGNTLIAVGTYSGPSWLYRTNDFGASWTKTNLGAFASGLVDCYMISNDTILVAGIADAANNFAATILRSVDGGAQWTRVYLAPTPQSYCWKIFMRPNGLGLASVQYGSPIVARTTDGGATWFNVTVYNSATSDLGGIGLLNDTLGWVFDQYDFGTWQTTDGGLTWSALPASPVESGDRFEVFDSITALVTGSSVYKYASGTTGVAGVKPLKNKIHSLIVSPNPAQKEISISVNAGQNTFGLLFITDEKGNVIGETQRQPFVKGESKINRNVSKLTAGTYVVHWRTNELFLAEKFTVVK
ncbi:MAG TPA: hypothetical protein PKN75_05165 [Bacteroidia bacterium]|nr:hypothetical protein [Bacteroidia bacterium]